MTENCIERNKRLNTEKKIADFRVKQKLDYDFKIKYAEARAWEFYNHPDVAGNCYVAVGGLDSITLLMFLRKIGINVPDGTCKKAVGSKRKKPDRKDYNPIRGRDRKNS